MKNLYLRSCIALLCAASVVACGSGGSLRLGGTVNGLTKTGLVLTNNGGSDFTLVPRPSEPSFTFAFPSLVGTDDNYNVTVSAQPTGAVCTIREGTGNGRATSNVVSIVVDCITDSYELGGTVSGRSDGLVLANAPERLNITANGTFVFATKVNDGAPYAVTVLTQPTTGATCTITNGAGTMGTMPINNVGVTCP